MSVTACSFCGKSETPSVIRQPDDLVLIVGPGVCICSECVALSAKLLADMRAKAVAVADVP